MRGFTLKELPRIQPEKFNPYLPELSVKVPFPHFKAINLLMMYSIII